MILKAEGLHKTYNRTNKSVDVLKGVGLDVEQGDFISVVGPSGAGKSTLLHILAGLDRPSRGRVFFKGRDIYRLNDTDLCAIRNKEMGFVFQSYHLMQEFTVLENVAMPALIAARYKSRKDVLNKASELLGFAGIKSRAAHFPNELSGGEQQRAAIVRSLINEPQILFCDEPTGNLDSASGEQVLSLIRQLNRENNTTVVVVTHNIELAKSCRKTYSLKDGMLLS